MTKRIISLFIIMMMIFSASAVFASEIPVVPDPPSSETEPPTDYYTNENLLLSYTLNEDGTVFVNERWSVYCEGVPGVFTTKIFGYEGIEISDIRVTDGESKAYVRIFGTRDKDMISDIFTSSTSEDGNITTLKIYHQTTDDHFVINISYTITGAITNYADAGVFEHTVIDDRLFSEKMPDVTVNVITHRDLEKFSDFKMTIFSNMEHEITPVNKSETDFSFTDVPAGEPVSLRVVLPLDLFAGNTLKSDEYILGTQDYNRPEFYYITPRIWEVFTPSVLLRIDILTTVSTFPGGWAGIILMLTSPVFILAGITLLGRRNKKATSSRRPYRSEHRTRYLDSFPDSLGYAHAARLMSHTRAEYMDRPRYFSSTVLSLYAKGYISILSTKRNLKITIPEKRDESNLTKHERLMLSFIEDAMGENAGITMKEISEYMFYDCHKVNSLHSSIIALLDEDLLEMGYLSFESNNILYRLITSHISAKVFMVYSVLMIFFAGICNFMFVMGKGRGFLALGMLVLFGILILALSRTPVKCVSRKGEDYAAKWNAFARFLNEADRLITEEDIHNTRGSERLFVYAEAFGANKRSLRHLNHILPWVGEDKDDHHLTGAPKGEMYSISISRLLQFMDDLEKMTDNCLKLYASEKGPFYKQRSRKRIRYFLRQNEGDTSKSAMTASEEIISEEDTAVNE